MLGVSKDLIIYTEYNYKQPRTWRARRATKNTIITSADTKSGPKVVHLLHSTCGKQNIYLVYGFRTRNCAKVACRFAVYSAMEKCNRKQRYASFSRALLPRCSPYMYTKKLNFYVKMSSDIRTSWDFKRIARSKGWLYMYDDVPREEVNDRCVLYLCDPLAPFDDERGMGWGSDEGCNVRWIEMTRTQVGGCMISHGQ